MNIFKVFVLTSMLLFVSCSCAQTSDSTSAFKPAGGETESLPSYVKDEILVKYKEGTTTDAAATTARSYGLELVKQISSNLYLYKITDGVSVPDMIEKLRSSDTVLYSEPNHIVTINK